MIVALGVRMHPLKVLTNSLKNLEDFLNGMMASEKYGGNQKRISLKPPRYLRFKNCVKY